MDGDLDVDADDLPANYRNAVIVYSDDQNIHLTLTPDDSTDVEPDLKIKFAQAAVATDSIGFDVNDKNGMHIQGIEGTTYFGDTANDNTRLTIDDPGVMTVDSEDLSIVWNPVTETWHWSNPEDANLEGTLVRGLTTSSTAAVATTTANITITNVGDLNMVASGINLRYDERVSDWDWNMALKADDFTDQVFNFVPLNDPILSIRSVGSQGAMASSTITGTPTDITLTWDGSAWLASSGGGTTGITIDAVNSNNTQVEFQLWERDDLPGTSAGASVIRYAFGSPLTPVGGQTLMFSIDPTPPEEYPVASLTTSGVTTANGIGIDFDSDTVTDLIIDTTAGMSVALSDGDYLQFNTNPDRPPEEYPDAILKGDYTEAVIDLDGSGNETDDRDIVFSFSENLRYGSSTHPFIDRSVISFDIKGSTAWTEISKDSIRREGYYEFTPDFLGGEFGSTETDIKFNIGTRFDGINFINDSLSTTQYSKSSSTIFQDADGYAAGDLQGVDVASDGILTGVYSNGQLIPLFRIGLAKFQNNYGLSNEGGNLFSETRESGSAITNKPGENGLGTLAPNSLEMSNVDISEEFVNMITQQRGFQANSKTVTTVDEMMNTVIQMKR